MVASAQVETTLLFLKLAFLVLLYLFIWRIVRSAARDLRLPQESMILAPQQAAAAGLIAQPAARDFGRLVVLGRSKDADLQVNDPNVSRRHAELRQEGATYWVVDLDSTNGVEVKGKRVKRLKLDDGDRFTLGSTEIVFSRELK